MVKDDGKRYVPKGTYAHLADKVYLSKRDEVNDYAPRMLNLVLKLKGIEQEAFAARMGLSVSAFRDRLRGKTSISVGELVGAAMLLDVPLSVLIDRSTNMDQVLKLRK